MKLPYEVHINLTECRCGFMEMEQHDNTSTETFKIFNGIGHTHCAQIQRAGEKLSSDLLCSHPFCSAAVPGLRPLLRGNMHHSNHE
jgi:hypothetical protein